MAENRRAKNTKPFTWYFGRWAWVILMAEAILLITSPIFLANKVFHTQVIAAAIAIVIGVLTALFTRRLMPKSSLFLRIIIPLSALLLCLVAINWITAGQAGFGSLHDPLYGSPLWGLFALGLGMAAIILTLLAWPKKLRRRTRRQPVSPTRPRRQTVPAENRRSEQVARPSTMPAGAALAASAAGPRSVAGGPTPAVQSIQLPRRRRRDNHLRFSDVEEHRCPYCLEVVEPNDRRGVVICEICHAYHHKDCWDVTGRCQVPHQSLT